MKAQVRLDKARHEVVAVVIALVAVELQRPPLAGGYLCQRIDMQLLGEEGIIQPRIHQGWQRCDRLVAQQLAGIPLLPQQGIATKVGAKRLLAPGAAARVANRAEGRDRAVATWLPQRSDQRPVTAHGVAADGALGRNREVGLDEFGQLAGDVVIHLVVSLPGGLAGIDVKACAHAEVITGIVRYAVAAGAGIRRHQCNAELGGDALGARLLHEVFIGAGEAAEPVEYRHLLAGEGLGRQIDGKIHLAAEHAGVVAIALVPAAEALVAADNLQIHRRTPAPRPRRRAGRSCSVVDDGADALALVHQFERLVDLLQRHGVGDEVIEAEFTLHVALHIARQFAATANPAEGATAPDPAGHQLERTGADLLTRSGDADDDRLAPTLVAALQRCTHHLDVADALEGEVDAAVGQLDDHLLNRFVVIVRVDAVGGAQLARQLELALVDVDGDDATSLGQTGADHRREADAPQPEDGDALTLFHLGGVHHGTDAGGDATTEQTDLFQRGGRVHLGDGDLRQYRVFAEGGGAHVVIDGLAIFREAGGAVRHQPLALGGADLLAEVGLAGFAEFALAALGSVERDHVIADFDAGDPFADGFDDAAPLVAENAGEDPFRIFTGEGEGIGVADAGGDDAHPHLARLRRHDLNLFDGEGLTRAPGDGGFTLDALNLCHE